MGQQVVVDNRSGSLRQYRHGSCRARGAGWLHARDQHAAVRDQRVSVRPRALRRRQRFRADFAIVVHCIGADGAPVSAGALGARSHPDRESAAGLAQLRRLGRGHQSRMLSRANPSTCLPGPTSWSCSSRAAPPRSWRQPAAKSVLRFRAFPKPRRSSREKAAPARCHEPATFGCASRRAADRGYPGGLRIHHVARHRCAQGDTARGVVTLLNQKITPGHARSRVCARFYEQRGFDIIASTRLTSARRLLKRELAKWGRVIKERGMRAD